MVLSNGFFYERIQLDTINERFNKVPTAKEGDANGRGMIVVLTENGLVKNTTGVSLLFKWEHTRIAGAQGLEDFEPLDLTKGEYIVTYPAEMNHEGYVKAEIRIIDNGKYAGSRNMKIQVEPSVGDDTAMESSNEFSALVTALLQVNSWNTTIDGKIVDWEADMAATKQLYIDNMEEVESTYPIELNSVKQQLEQAVIVADTAALKADAMASGSPKGVYATVALLQAAYPTGTTGAYLVTADGNWYYWSGSAWTVGGLYQAGTLKNYKRALTAGDNLDTFLTEGAYLLTTATTPGTYPSGVSTYAIFEVQGTGNFITQKITNTVGYGVGTRSWVRSWQNAWGAWVETTVTQTLKDDIAKLKADVNGFPMILRELPNGVKDTFVDNGDGTYTLTQNVKEVALVDANIYGLVTTPVNIDYVRIFKPADFIGAATGDSIAGGLVLEGTLGDKVYADNVANIGYVSSVSADFFGPVLAKGTYADTAATKAALIGKKLTYQLKTPIIHTIDVNDTTNTRQIAKLTSDVNTLSITSATKPWAGKVANFLGDSITEGATVDGSYVPVVKDLLGLSVANNYGIGGGRLCKTTPEIDALYTPLIDRYTSIDMTADIIFVLIGTNDYSSQVPLGATTIASTYEFNGALNIMMDWFRDNFPDKLVIFSTLLHRYNDEQYTIKAQEYRDAIKERCLAKKFVCYDAFENTGFDFVAGYYDRVLTNDGLHPNAAGNTILGRKIAGFINAQ